MKSTGTIKQFINDLGGVAFVADRLVCDAKRIYAWIERDTVPFKHRPEVLALADKLNVKPPKTLIKWAQAA